AEGRRGAVMDDDPRWNRRELRELHVEAVADAVCARLDEHVAAAKVAALDAGQRDGDTLSGFRDVDLAVVHLHAAHADLAVLGLSSEDVARRDPARPERARRHRSDPAQRKDAVDEEPDWQVVAIRLRCYA